MPFEQALAELREEFDHVGGAAGFVPAQLPPRVVAAVLAWIDSQEVTHEWGVKYLDDDGDPSFDEADDQRDAEAWAQDGDGTVVKREVRTDRGLWTEVASS